MSTRRILFWAGSVALTVAFIVILVKVSKLNFHVTLEQLRSVSWSSFATLVLLTGLHVFLSTLKWRRVDLSMRRPEDSAPAMTTSFALTSIGVALGQVLPVQVSMSLARTLGTYLHGRAIRRGTGGTLFEQFFDVLIVIFLVIASGVTWFYHGGGIMWTLCALAMTALAMLSLGPAVHFASRQVATWNARKPAPTNRFLRSLGGLEHSGLLNGSLARELMALSAARFVVQVLMAGEAAQAIGVHIPLWHLAAAIPFVTIACVLVVTPGGMGVNELSYAATLHLFGTPLNVGAQWALANRFLVASSCFVVAACAALALGSAKAIKGTKNKNATASKTTPASAPVQQLQEDKPW